MTHAKNVGHQNLRDLIFADRLDVFRDPHDCRSRGGRMKSKSRRSQRNATYRSKIRTRMTRRLSRLKALESDYAHGILPGLFPFVWSA